MITVNEQNNLEKYCRDEGLEELLSQWSEKNGFLPSQITRASCRMVWWKCKTCGTEWQATPNNRTRQKSGCPKCSCNRIPDDTLADWCRRTGNQPLLAEWNTAKNLENGITPENIKPHSVKSVWWICRKCGMEWRETPHSRLSGGSAKYLTGCPVCIKVQKSFSVRCTETGVIYFTAQRAAIEVGDIEDDSQIKRSCRSYRNHGYQGHKSAYGYHFVYMNGDEPVVCIETGERFNTLTEGKIKIESNMRKGLDWYGNLTTQAHEYPHFRELVNDL